MKKRILLFTILLSYGVSNAQVANYKMTDTLFQSNLTLEPGSGQLSKSDKEFYFSVRNLETGTSEIYVCERSKSEQSFSLAEPLNERYIAGRVLHPTMSEDELQMVYVKEGDTRSQNNLWLASRRKKSEIFDDVRVLDELNAVNAADELPYLSPDARDLYYIKDARIYHALRTDDHAVFSPGGEIMFPEFIFETGGVNGVWLSANQLHIFFIYDFVIYTANRITTFSDWGIPYLYCYPRTEDAFISGLSFSENLEEMFLLVSYDGKDFIIRFEKK